MGSTKKVFKQTHTNTAAVLGFPRKMTKVHVQIKSYSYQQFIFLTISPEFQPNGKFQRGTGKTECRQMRPSLPYIFIPERKLTRRGR